MATKPEFFTEVVGVYYLAQNMKNSGSAISYRYVEKNVHRLWLRCQPKNDISHITFHKTKGSRMIDFLVHNSRDNVGVAVRDVQSGENLAGKAMDNGKVFNALAVQPIPLGHKIALRDFKVGDTVIKYGEDIGKVVANIRAGEHVHIHNLKTKRW